MWCCIPSTRLNSKLTQIDQHDVKMIVKRRESVNFEAKYLDEEASYDSPIWRGDRGPCALSFWCRVPGGASALNVHCLFEAGTARFS